MGLNEVFASAMQGAAAKGTELLAQPVEIGYRGLNQGGWELVSGLKEMTLGCPVSFSRDAEGGGMLMLTKGHAALMAELMIGNEPADMPAELSAMQLTAAAEALSQMVAAIGEGLGRASRRTILASAGEPGDMSGDAIVAAAKGLVRDERIAVADCTLRIGQHPVGRIALVVSGAMAASLAVDKPESVMASAPDMILGAQQSAGAGGRTTVQPVQFGTFQAPSGVQVQPEGNLDLLMDVPLDITVELGRASRRVRDVLGLSPGSIVELSKLAGEPVDLLVNGRPIAKGEVVVIDENFAVRIVEILSREDRIAGGL